METKSTVSEVEGRQGLGAALNLCEGLSRGKREWSTVLNTEDRSGHRSSDSVTE